MKSTSKSTIVKYSSSSNCNFTDEKNSDQKIPIRKEPGPSGVRRAWQDFVKNIWNNRFNTTIRPFLILELRQDGSLCVSIELKSDSTVKTAMNMRSKSSLYLQNWFSRRVFIVFC